MYAAMTPQSRSCFTKQGSDVKEVRTFLANAVATRIAGFIEQAQSTLDIAIYDFGCTAIQHQSSRSPAKQREGRVVIRIAFDTRPTEPHLLWKPRLCDRQKPRVPTLSCALFPTWPA
jgi:RecB family exonuclease